MEVLSRLGYLPFLCYTDFETSTVIIVLSENVIFLVHRSYLTSEGHSLSPITGDSLALDTSPL